MRDCEMGIKKEIQIQNMAIVVITSIYIAILRACACGSHLEA